MSDPKQKALNFLNKNNICYQIEEHPAVFTVEESSKVKSNLEGYDTKNLFLRDKKKTNYYLFVVGSHKRVDLKKLSSNLNLPRLSFGSAADLEELLGTIPGSVSLLSIINDTSSRVKLFVDQDVIHASRFKCHPLINTATVSLDSDSIELIAGLNQHEVHKFKVPELDL